MRRVMLATLTVFALAALGASAAFADAPGGALQFATQAQQIISTATVTYLGDSWGPVPLYEVDLRPALNATIDVADYTADAARSDPSVLDTVETELWQNAGSPPAPSAPPVVTDPGAVSDAVQPYVAQATTLVAAAPVTYVGDSWGPEPIYELNLLQPLNATIDVYAYTAAAANSDPGAIALVATQLWQNAGSPAAPNNTPPPAPGVQTQPPIAPAVETAPSASSVVSAAASAGEAPAVMPPVVAEPVATVAPVTIPTTPAVPSVTYAPRIQITISASAAKQPTVSATLTKALGTKITLSKTVRMTSSGKVTTLARVKSLLANGKSVKITLHKIAGKYVVTGIAL